MAMNHQKPCEEEHLLSQFHEWADMADQIFTQEPQEKEWAAMADQNSVQEPKEKEWADMADQTSTQDPKESFPQIEGTHADERFRTDTPEDNTSEPARLESNGIQVEYRLYKRRWFGLVQLVLLNIMGSWGWLSFSPVANTAATYFSTSTSTISWLSTAFLFSFVAAAPPTLYALRTGGPRLAFIACSLLLLLGNWLRYGGTRCSPPSFPLVMTGQVLIGLAQPFVLAAPTLYSNLWFSPRGRVSATAVASLANPLGAALGELINPFLASEPSDIPKMTLVVALISTVVAIPSFFMPVKPPTPSSASADHARPSIRQTFSLLARNKNFFLLLAPFAVYVALFNSASSLLTEILTPYGFSENESGISGALLIIVGLVGAAVSSPLIDRSKAYVPFLKICVPVIAACYLAFIWAPPTRMVVVPYIILSVLGAVSFSLVPIALEMLVEVTFPIGPEVGSTICWTGGQLLGGLFIVISDSLQADEDARPPRNMQHALIFQAAAAWAVVPAVIALGWGGAKVALGRTEVDNEWRRGSGSTTPEAREAQAESA